MIHSISLENIFFLLCIFIDFYSVLAYIILIKYVNIFTDKDDMLGINSAAFSRYLQT